MSNTVLDWISEMAMTKISNTRSTIVICDRDTWEQWQAGDVVWDNWDEEFRDTGSCEEELLHDIYGHYSRDWEAFEDDCIRLNREPIYTMHITPSGDEVVVWGFDQDDITYGDD